MNSHNHHNLENSRKDFFLLVIIVSWCLLWRRNSHLNSVIRPQRPSGDRFPSTTWPYNIILISGLIRATLVSGIGLKVLNLGHFAYNFETFGERKKKLCYRVLSTVRNHVNMEWYRCMLHESIKTKRNAFPYLSKHASEAFSLIFTLSNHFTHFKTIWNFWPLQYFSRYSVSRYFLTRYSLLRYSV